MEREASNKGAMEMTKNQFIAILIAALVFVSALFIRGCGGPASVESPDLGPHQELSVSVKDRVITARTKEAVVSEYVPEGGSATVTLANDGLVDLYVKSKGFLIRPVLGSMITRVPNVAVGVQIAYWNRFELYGGLTFPNQVAGFAGLGYRLDQVKLHNTSLYVAYTTQKDIGVGLLLRF